VKDCNHQVTLILFARKFYKSKDSVIEGSSLQQDRSGHCYEDLYKVILQNESYSDWSTAIVQIKQSFQSFCNHLLVKANSHFYLNESSDSREEWISSSNDGNILETINLALNVLEMSYKSCSFMTTGQQIVLVSPGMGVFHVDRELNRLTRERVIDYSVGVDLICLNEQPLHAVPLFKFNQTHVIQEEHYSVPHWMNYSFYNPIKPWTKYRFQPRMKISDQIVNESLKIKPSSKCKSVTELISLSVNGADPLTHYNVDYDEYDDNIFADSTNRKKTTSLSDDIITNDTTDGPITHGSMVEHEEFEMKDIQVNPKHDNEIPIKQRQPRTRHYSDNYDFSRSSYDENALFKVGSADLRDERSSQMTTPLFKRKKTFINPFDPKKIHVELNSNYCRWMHTFPCDANGKVFQTHHIIDKHILELDEDQDTPAIKPDGTQAIGTQASGKLVGNFASVRRLGMDWTSLTEPACLPLTTDYYPGDSSIVTNYLDYPSSLVANNYNGELGSVSNGWRSDHHNMDTFQSFREMISQRLCQGFQLVVDACSLFNVSKEITDLEDKKKKQKGARIRLSLGRIYHTMSLSLNDSIDVHIHKLKTSLDIRPFTYHYTLISSEATSISCTSAIKYDRVDNYNWNYLDQHVCGHSEFEQYQESHKYCRIRFLLLPSTPPPTDTSLEDKHQWLSDVTNSFLRFFEFINNIKRTPSSSSHKKKISRMHSLPVESNYSPPLPHVTKFSSFQGQQTPSRSLSAESPGKTRRHSSKTEIRRVKSREDISRDSDNDQQRSKTPQHQISKRSQSPVASYMRRHSNDLKDRGSPTLTSPHPREKFTLKGRQRGLGIVGSPMERDEEITNDIPSFHIVVPSTPTVIPPDDDKEGSNLEGHLEQPSSSLLNIDSSLNLILNALLDKEDGVDLLINQPSLKHNSFVSMEAVQFLQETLEGQPSRNDIIRIMQRMIDDGLIIHASGDRRVPFIDGYYLYYSTDSEGTIRDTDDWDTFRKKWFEVAILDPKRSNMTPPDSQPSSFTHSCQNSPYYMHHTHYKPEHDRRTLSDLYTRFVEFNPDPKSLSDRPEWCYVHYDHTYNQMRGFGIEFHWMACTISLLYKLIQNWIHKASMCGFNLVPVSSLGALGLVNSSVDLPHPFIHPSYIPLALPRDFIENTKESPAIINCVFLKVLNKYGFIVDPSCLNNDDDGIEQSWMFLSHIFIHHSGTAIVQPVYQYSKDPNTTKCGFHWLSNEYYLKLRSTSQAVVNKYDELINSFTLYCSTAENNDTLIN
jgi:hypothetical protein